MIFTRGVLEVGCAVRVCQGTLGVSRTVVPRWTCRQGHLHVHMLKCTDTRVAEASGDDGEQGVGAGGLPGTQVADHRDAVGVIAA